MLYQKIYTAFDHHQKAAFSFLPRTEIRQLSFEALN